MTVGKMAAMFLCGFVGSAALEVVTVYQHYQNGVALPKRYKSCGFWVVRVCLALMGGGLALAYEIDKAVLAINIGAATPLIIKAFAEGFTQPPVPAPTATRKTARTRNGKGQNGNGTHEAEATSVPRPATDAPISKN